MRFRLKILRTAHDAINAPDRENAHAGVIPLIVQNIATLDRYFSTRGNSTCEEARHSLNRPVRVLRDPARSRALRLP